MPKKIKKRNAQNSIPTTRGNNHSYLYWILSAFASGLFLAVLYTLLRNQQTNLALITHSEAPVIDPILTNFFPVAIEQKNTGLGSVKFSMDDSISNSDQELILNYNKQLKKILSTTSLSSANKLALSKTTIQWVPYTSADHPKDGIINAFVSIPRQINIVLQEKLIKEELRSSLLNEIHHVTVADINLYRVHDESTKKFLIQKGFIMYPFLDAKGKMDEVLKSELSLAVDEFFHEIEKFKALFINNQRNSLQEKEFNEYLQTIKNYHPKIYRLHSPINTEANHMEVNFSQFENNSPLLKMDSILYRHHRPTIKHLKTGKIEVLLSANRDDSLLERARAFLFDITHSHNKINSLYKDRDKSKGTDDKQLHSNFLREISSEIDERLIISMKNKFAKRFKNYFNGYAEPYLAAQDASHSKHTMDSFSPLRPGR